ncbi:MAG: LysR family transcriptional regulator [Coriobacteriales bacterium]|nr:LysR family transcriptional regulator [Coriobacteriales bacterium]
MGNPEIYQLRYFVETAKHERMSTASNELGISEQALSKAIKNLESQLGEELFVRSSKGLSLTEFGRFFLTRARIAVEAMQFVEDSPSDYTKKYRKTISLGLPASCLADHGGSLNPANLSALQKQYPDIRFVFVEATPAVIGQRLKEGTLQFGICADLDGRLLENFVLGEYLLVSLVHTDNPLSQKDSITLKDVTGGMIAVFSDNTVMTRFLKMHAVKASISPVQLSPVDPGELIMNKDTFMFMPQQHAYRVVKAPHVKILPLVDEQGAQMKVSLCLSWMNTLVLGEPELALAKHIACLYGKTFDRQPASPQTDLGH